MAVTARKTATERRDEILEAALVEFAAHGLDGGSIDAVAKAVENPWATPVSTATCGRR